MSLDKTTVARIAQLARIRVPEEELEPLAGELGHILSWVEQLNELDTADVPPMASPTAQSLPWREDVVTDGGYAGKIVGNAPEVVKGYFAVPKVIE